MKPISIAFVGGGNMARSLVGGLVADGVPATQLTVSEPEPARRQALKREFGVSTTADNAAAAAVADVVVLAVKPQVMPGVARELAGPLAGRPVLVISIAAGIRTTDLARWLGDVPALARAMPNTPALLGCGATVLFAAPRVTEAQREQAESILRAVGSVSWVEDESQLDAVTALSGSGPAYYFLLSEAMAEAAAELGLDPALAELLAVETALGAARMAIESDEDVAELRRRVTSPGGTTEAALEALEAGGFRRLVAQALASAQERSRAIAERFGKE
jgi:pyrroline-5-carboxylate reductase